jgi:hypothetical protein
MTMRYLAIGNNAKTVKSDNGGEYLTAIMYLLPDDEICAMSATARCQGPCLNTAGRGAMTTVQKARAIKTADFKADPIQFVDRMADDVVIALRMAKRLGVKLAGRPNGTSDIPWEHMHGSDGRTLMEKFPMVEWYDYTKLAKRKVPENYHLTVSYSGANADYARQVLSIFPKHDRNIAVVFRTKEMVQGLVNGSLRLPPEFRHFEGAVIDGDRDDLRFMDRKVYGSDRQLLVALYAKGKAKHDTSGFVVDVI